MAVEIQLEKLRVHDAMSARDAVVHRHVPHFLEDNSDLLSRLCDAYDIVRQKSATIARLELEKEDLRVKLANIEAATAAIHDKTEDENNRSDLTAEVQSLQDVIKKLQEEIKLLTDKASPDPPPQYEMGLTEVS